MTCAILQALVDRGMRPVAFKCGPNYIDPMFHSARSLGQNPELDLFFLGADTTWSTACGEHDGGAVWPWSRSHGLL